ncbi:hypothetical protein NPIL_182201 [Nephila pilipes]|uniref:Uncharacterized protein n=1 Tax=Nephila pilipes TaxID=299642 RepID=A0A8X6MP16_NEPPI|nr:hypothetical protein NPIL_182201 [Nephila pilipes]
MNKHLALVKQVLLNELMCHIMGSCPERLLVLSSRGASSPDRKPYPMNVDESLVKKVSWVVRSFGEEDCIDVSPCTRD